MTMSDLASRSAATNALGFVLTDWDFESAGVAAVPEPGRKSMIYMSYQASSDMLAPFRALARSMADALPHLAPGHIEGGGSQATWLSSFWAGCQIVARSG